MHPLTGFTAVITACLTSGLAGVYFEMVLKSSKADLWVRNVQLSLFSMIPAFIPLIVGPSSVIHMFDHFGLWAWATVFMQVFGGLVTALVIKYSDNILKGFATSLSILLSFLASVVLFGFRITPSFLLGLSTVLAATWTYNQSRDDAKTHGPSGKETPFPGSPVDPDSPILGQFSDKKRSSLVDLNPRVIAASLGLSSSGEDIASSHFKDNQRYRMQQGVLTSRPPYSGVSSRNSTPPSTRSHTPQPKDDRIYLR